MMRHATVKRQTLETNVEVSLTLESTKPSKVQTGMPFLDHMLTLFAFHGNLVLDVNLNGDLDVDSHHSAEDLGIALGKAFNDALGNRAGIARYADNLTPMDEVLVRGALDISGRSKLVYQDKLKREMLGNVSSEDFYVFFEGLVRTFPCALHMEVLYGDNDHHKIEGIFKSFGRLIKDATKVIDKRIPSSKGVL